MDLAVPKVKELVEQAWLQEQIRRLQVQPLKNKILWGICYLSSKGSRGGSFSILLLKMLLYFLIPRWFRHLHVRLLMSYASWGGYLEKSMIGWSIM